MAGFDDIKESHNKIPGGWMAFFIGVILWLIAYIIMYTPEISGWSQYKILEKEMKVVKSVPAKIPANNPYKGNDMAIKEGKALYSSNCAVCHGKDLKGGVGPDITQTTLYGTSDEKRFESISKGRPNGMPAFEQQLGADRIWKIIAYMDTRTE
jgi:cytochrome c oxidase cbb3-type subunit 3